MQSSLESYLDDIKHSIRNGLYDWFYSCVNVAFIHKIVNQDDIKISVKNAFKLYNKNIICQRNIANYVEDAYSLMDISIYFDDDDGVDVEQQSKDEVKTNIRLAIENDADDDESAYFTKTVNDFVQTIPRNTYILTSDMLKKYNI